MDQSQQDKIEFAPMQPGSAGEHALNHIAFYLAEIEQHLGTIAKAFDRNEAFNISQVLQSLGMPLSRIAKELESEE